MFVILLGKEQKFEYVRDNFDQSQFLGLSPSFFTIIIINNIIIIHDKQSRHEYWSINACIRAKRMKVFGGYLYVNTYLWIPTVFGLTVDLPALNHRQRRPESCDVRSVAVELRSRLFRSRATILEEAFCYPSILCREPNTSA